MKVAYIRWKDACTHEANETTSVPVSLALVELCNVGFLLGENDEAVAIGMEIESDDCEPGRFRMNIPKSQIIDMKVADVDVTFKRKRVRKSSGKDSSTK